MDHDDNVDFYAHGMAHVPVHFPHGKVDCRHCRFCGYKEAFNLFYCKLTEQLIEKYELDERNQMCPVQLDDVPF